MPGAHARLRTAQESDLAAVLAVLDEAAARLAVQGVVQWPASFTRALLEPAFAAGQVWLAEQQGAPVATFTLAWSDVLWPDDGAAGYLHRFAVRRSVAGLGCALLDRAAALVHGQGRELLRLDCMADNPALRAYYERAGFRHVDDVEVPRAAVRWSVRAPVVSRYERPVVPPAAPA